MEKDILYNYILGNKMADRCNIFSNESIQFLNNLIISGDVFIDGNLYVSGFIFIKGDLFITGDVDTYDIDDRLSAYPIVVQGNMFVGGKIYFSTDVIVKDKLICQQEISNQGMLFAETISSYGDINCFGLCSKHINIKGEVNIGEDAFNANDTKEFMS
jgi:predicted acyltransferase (DUF342 family)